MYEYTKIKGLDSGKITSLPKRPERDQQYEHHLNHRQPHAHREIYLHTIKVFTILIPVFTVSARNAREPDLPFVS